ncbi:MAG TPA: xanthine dehydrogenase family protein molybdopterin-binding subunit, partial [Myxococcota bacterium]
EAHARLRSVDASRARAHPGVHRVLTGEEAGRLCRPIVAYWPGEPCEQPAMAVDTVRFVGEIVAAVVADDRYVAEDALELVEVDAEPLPAVTSAAQAMAPGAPCIQPGWPDNVFFRETLGGGDVDAAFAGAHASVEFTCQMNRQCASPIEARAVLAAYDPQLGEMTVWTSSQMPHMVRTKIAELIDFPEHKLRVIAPDVGGGFGVKGHLCPEELLVPALSRALGRPVRWIEDRREHLSAAFHAKEETVSAALALEADGALRGMKASFISDAGAYSNFPWTSASEPSMAAMACPGPYRIPAVRAEAAAVFTNKMGSSMVRGVGLPAAALAIEHALDLAAHRLGMDPAEIRRRNMLARADFPHDTATGFHYDSGSPLESLERALEMIGYAERRREQAEARAQGRYLGLGIGPFIEGTTFGYDYPDGEQWWANAGVYESAHLRVDPGGGVVLGVGTHSHGQSHATVFAQLVASVLGCDVGDVEFVQGDTARTPYGWGTWGSRSAVAGGGAVIRAAELVRDKILRVAAHLLGTEAAALELAEGSVRLRSAPERGLSLREVARAAVYEGRVPDDEAPGLEVTYHYKPPSPFSNATHVAWVEVDPELGRVEILRYAVAEDCGTIINPTVVEGQIAGGVAQGIGSTLLEEHRYDESGQLLTASLMDYLLPTASDVPSLEIDHLETPSPLSVAGIKGMGEGGAVGPVAALTNAVSDALVPLCGWQPVTKLPITPERVWQMIRAGRR